MAETSTELEKPVTHNSNGVNNTFKEDFKKESSAILAELCFIILPFIVILIVNFTKGEESKLLQTSDWALAATLLYGQTIVKMIMGVASQAHEFHYQNWGFISALIIVFGLVPSITVLTIFQIYSRLSAWLVIIQFMLFGIAIIVFVIFGTIGQILFATAFRSKISKLLKLTK
ncbi:MAG TPA: hypothetical protein VFE53_11435 [Mucilaginibacter sp.]|jgi:hypothetical protein|nr:hypothetical protein [Mucilaginibacter sp.]